MSYERVVQTNSQTSPGAYSTPPRAAREAKGTAGVQWSPIIEDEDDVEPGENGGLYDGAATTHMDANLGLYNDPDFAGVARGTGPVPVVRGEPSPLGTAPLLPTEQTSSNLDLTGGFGRGDVARRKR